MTESQKGLLQCLTVRYAFDFGVALTQSVQIRTTEWRRIDGFSRAHLRLEFRPQDTDWEAMQHCWLRPHTAWLAEYVLRTSNPRRRGFRHLIKTKSLQYDSSRGWSFKGESCVRREPRQMFQKIGLWFHSTREPVVLSMRCEHSETLVEMSTHEMIAINQLPAI